MNISDPIADLLTRIRNASRAGHDTVEIPNSSIKNELARILKREGFIQDYTVEGSKAKSTLKLYLKYTVNEEPVIQGLKRISKPGLRQYVQATDVPRVLGGMGLAILSTSHGVVTDQEARKDNVGGEVLCHVW
jgi:small subunit ribosomal protein S8